MLAALVPLVVRNGEGFASRPLRTAVLADDGIRRRTRLKLAGDAPGRLAKRTWDNSLFRTVHRSFSFALGGENAPREPV